MTDEPTKQTVAADPRHRVRTIVLATIGAVAILAVGIGVVPRLVGDREEQPGLAQFYEQPAGAAQGMPGTIVQSEPLEGHPLDAKAWRIMYRTTDVQGKTVVATGVVVTPQGDPPQGGRTVLAWAHPTTGVADRCAPSRSLDPFLDVEGIRAMLDRGYTVVATDYVGMGTSGPDSYLVGVTAGNSVLDSVRAAQALPGAEASSQVILWGHSQGGQAVLFAAENAAEYAPELHIKAVAAAAPAADLSALMEAHLDDVSGVTIGSYAFQAYSEVYADEGADLDEVLTPSARKILPQMNDLCLLTQMSELHEIADPVVGAFFAHDPTEAEPWATLLRDNSAGAKPISVPVFIAQGAKDELVVPKDTEAFVGRERALGIDVTYHSVARADHGTIAYLALPALNDWLDGLGI